MCPLCAEPPTCTVKNVHGVNMLGTLCEHFVGHSVEPLLTLVFTTVYIDISIVMNKTNCLFLFGLFFLFLDYDLFFFSTCYVALCFPAVSDVHHYFGRLRFKSGLRKEGLTN